MKNESKHTEGPWKAVEDDEDWSVREAATDMGWMYTSICERIPNEADAHLIAAAPAMYELLSGMKEHGMQPEKIEAVLAKARGEAAHAQADDADV